MVTRERLYTADELWDLSHRPANAGRRLELSEGRLIIMSPAGWKHGALASKLLRIIGDFAEVQQLGMTTAAETGYILHRQTAPDDKNKDVVRAPDVGFITARRLPANLDDLPDGYVPFAPDLAVEVVSPGDEAAEIRKKVQEYLRYGTRLVWLFDPKARTVEVHTRGGAVTLGVDGVLEGGDVLPGFRLPLKDLFS